MPLRPTPTFKAVSDKMLEIPQPAIGGLNLKDLEYEQEVGQSPYMLNMMYRNGAFSKRYGQGIYKTLENSDVHSMIMYREHLFTHCGTNIYMDDDQVIEGGTDIPNKKGLFCLFNSRLYYFNNDIYEIYYNEDQYKKLLERPDNWDTDYATYFVYSNGSFVANTLKDWQEDTFYKPNVNINKYVCEKVEPYIPTVSINRTPDGKEQSSNESYNMVGTGFKNKFHGDATAKVFKLTDVMLDNKTPRVIIDNEEWKYQESLTDAKTFKVDFEKGEITLKSAAPKGTNNVEIIAYAHDKEWSDYHDQIMNSKFYATFGGNNNSRLFLAGGGKSTYYYSGVFDVTYFPYTNYARVGNSADDITGFGQQYNVLIIFKPTEIFSLTYYQATEATTIDPEQVGVGAFSSQVVNSSIGCDCPNTIQLINNQLTWFSSRVGVCTLVSTNIIDERNVRLVSRNIDRTNNFDVKGILDIKLNENSSPIYDSVKSIDFENKYFLIFPKEYKGNEVVDCGLCYVWDYEISPYVVSSTRITNPKDLSWFLFDHLFVKDLINVNGDLVYSSTLSQFSGKLINLNNSFEDLDFDGDGLADEIDAYYMTPFFQFEAVEYLKTIKDLYIQCRGDTASTIDVYYYTDDSPNPEQDAESIRIGGKVWKNFSWETFEWFVVNWANTFRRKCSLKKIQMASFLFKNNQIGRDMSITHIAIKYQIIKNIK